MPSLPLVMVPPDHCVSCMGAPHHGMRDIPSRHTHTLLFLLLSPPSVFPSPPPPHTTPPPPLPSTPFPHRSSSTLNQGVVALVYLVRGVMGGVITHLSKVIFPPIFFCVVGFFSVFPSSFFLSFFFFSFFPRFFLVRCFPPPSSQTLLLSLSMSRPPPPLPTSFQLPSTPTTLPPPAHTPPLLYFWTGKNLSRTHTEHIDFFTVSLGHHPSLLPLS